MQDYSVLMSVYIKADAQQFRTAADSMLYQTVPPEQFVLVCDGPLTDALTDAIGEYERNDPGRFHVIRLPKNVGLGPALQEGLLACRNELVARMDADDIALPDRMEKQLAAMERFDYPAVVGGQIAEFTRDISCVTGYRQVPLTYEKIKKQGGILCPVNHMTALFRKTEVLAAGGYHNFPAYEDYHLWVRLLSQGSRFYNIADLCCYARVDDDFYQRRGGWDYFTMTCRMERYILQHRLVGRFQFLCNVAARFIFTVLLPKGCRKRVFNRFLRKRELTVTEAGGLG